MVILEFAILVVAIFVISQAVWAGKALGLTFYGPHGRPIDIGHSIKDMLLVAVEIHPDRVIARLQF
jgi:hypothetical protein